MASSALRSVASVASVPLVVVFGFLLYGCASSVPEVVSPVAAPSAPLESEGVVTVVEGEVEGEGVLVEAVESVEAVEVVEMEEVAAFDPSAVSDAWGFTFPALEGKGEIEFDSYRGRVLLVVNTASRCGFTPQYAGLQELWEHYRYRGLVVIGVPSNDFAGQEPEGDAAIRKFCELRYGVTFPLASKQKVIGEDAHPFYLWAAHVRGAVARPRWNFHKYLIAPDGRIAEWYTPLTTPRSPRLLRAVERLLSGG